jgi:hypothetical protein
VRRATVVMYYGTKPARLESLIKALQQITSSMVGTSFRSKHLTDIHATLIRIENTLNGGRPKEAPDLEGLFSYLCSTIHKRPSTIQFGGFADRDYPISSRGRRLYTRSFALDRGKAVLIGWPITSPRQEPCTVLDEIRRESQRYNVVHKYHELPTSVDPDAYLVIGTYDPYDIRPDYIEKASDAIRKRLSESRVITRLQPSDLRVVLYTDEALPQDSSEGLPLCQLGISEKVARLSQR